MHASPEQLIALRDSDLVDAVMQTHVRTCTHCATELNALVDLHAALEKLPDFALPEGAWQAIAERVKQHESEHGFWRNGLRATGAALVASIVIAVSLAMHPFVSRAPADVTVTGAATSASVPQLMAQSSYLERAVHSLNADADQLVVSAGTAATVAALEDRIALLDYQINQAVTDTHDRNRLPKLWQQRVNLLQSLAAVRYAQVASSDI